MSTNGQNEFEAKARRVLEYLKSAQRYNEELLPRPFFIEFTGSPSAGKTTIITEMDKFLRRMGFRVWRPQEGAEVVRHIERTTPLYNIATCDYARKILVDESHGHKYDVVIFDRCVFDGYCWMMYWREKGKLTDEELKLYQSFFLSRFWVDKIDLAYFVVCDAQEAMRRELRIALSDKLGETTNPSTIATLVERYNQAYLQLHERFPQLKRLDTTSLDEKQMVERVATEILNMMEERAARKARPPQFDDSGPGWA